MLEIDDEQIIIASTLIALENRPSLKVEQLSSYVYILAREIGMKDFSESGFRRIFIPLAIPVLDNAGLIQLNKKSAFTPYTEVTEIEPDTHCKLTKNTLNNINKIRRGFRIRSGTRDQKQIFNNIFNIINGHLDERTEENAFKRHMDKGNYIPAVKLGN